MVPSRFRRITAILTCCTNAPLCTTPVFNARLGYLWYTILETTHPHRMVLLRCGCVTNGFIVRQWATVVSSVPFWHQGQTAAFWGTVVGVIYHSFHGRHVHVVPLWWCSSTVAFPYGNQYWCNTMVRNATAVPPVNTANGTLVPHENTTRLHLYRHVVLLLTTIVHNGTLVSYVNTTVVHQYHNSILISAVMHWDDMWTPPWYAGALNTSVVRDCIEDIKHHNHTRAWYIGNTS